ncbi:MAG: ATP-binding protein [Tatlockia sp.]|jgi:PAS domain S-box-containing protein
MRNNKKNLSFTLDEMGTFLSKFSEHSEQVYWISSPDFQKIQFVSASYERVWGRSRKELYAAPDNWIRYLHPDDATTHNPIAQMAEQIKRLGEKARYSAQYRILRPDGEIRWIIDNGFPLIDNKGACYGVTGVAIDVTEEHKKTEALEIAKEAAEAANLAKDEFLANMSHDIRTPLSGIIGISSLLEQQVQTLEEKENAHLVAVSGEQLLTLLNSVLDIVSVGDRKESLINLESVDINQLIQNIAELERPTTRLKQLELHILVDNAVPAFIQTDPVKLHRIVLNLIGNAIKFTNEGQISLTVNYNPLDKNKGQLELFVKDTGKGIAKENIDKVFDRFYRGDPSYKSQYTGFGVGLHIVQQYVSLLQGKISLESELGTGTVFHVSLPVEKGNAPSVAPSKPQARLPSRDGKKEGVTPSKNNNLPFLLLVEDNTIALKVVESVARQADCRFLSATNGSDALKLAKTHNFDLVLTDIGLPGLSGNELTAAIRAFDIIQKRAPVPIVGLTAHRVSSAEEESLQAGMNKVISKPISLATLLNLLDAFVAPQEWETPVASVKRPENEAIFFTLDAFPLLDAVDAASTLGSEALVSEFLTLMVKEELPKSTESIQQAYEKGDWKSVERIAHQMKSSALYCGTIRLKYACQYLEQQHKAGQMHLLNALYEQLLAVIEQTKDAIEEWMNPSTSL